MIKIYILGWGQVTLKHLVSDINGTLSIDGTLNEDAVKAFLQLKNRLELHLVTGNIHGNIEYINRKLNINAYCIPKGQEKEAKAAYVRKLGGEYVVAIGQGENDAYMLKQAKIGICILSPEGSSVRAMLSADVLASDVLSALDLLENPSRLEATLRH